MISYYGFTISPNQLETGEGFLICRNVPLARTGDQEYLGSELGLSGEDANRIITVHRPEAEVFSERALASFEGKPVTNDHPPDLIGPEDVKVYEMGHAQNVRRGTGEWSDFMIGDLHIHDASLIDAIQNGKKQISCGYGCDYTENEDGTYTQSNIIGNHIAVVDLARAGKRAAILDSINFNKAEKPERKANMKHAFLKLFGLAAQDKTPEEIEKLAGDAAEMLESEEVKEEKTEEETKDETPAIDDAVIDGIIEKVMAKLTEKRAEEEAEEEEKDPLDEAIEKLEGGEAEVEPSGDGESRVIPAEEMDEEAQCVDHAMAVSILKAMRPVIAGIKDSSERKAVADAMIKSVTTSDGDMAKLLNTVKDNATNKNTNKSVDMDELQNMYRQNNPHTRKAE